MPVYAIAQGRIENRETVDEYVAKAILPLRLGSTPGTLVVVDGLPS
jgi:hypothetical protein